MSDTIDDVADAAIARMRGPAVPPKTSTFAIIQMDITNRCDLQCSNCTRFLVNQPRHWDMTPDNFRMALRSMRGYRDAIGMIGGNPCLHPQFPELCKIFQQEVPNKAQRWLFSNNVFKHQEIVAETFGGFNLNPHGDKRGLASIKKLQKLLPNVPFYKGHSHHAPILAAIKDIEPNNKLMWDAIADCDFNKYWSASIIQNKGEIRAYFCEEAAAFDLARGEDHGHPVIEGWWRKDISEFSDQIKHFCPGCGVPAKLKGRLDTDEVDDYTETNKDIALKTRGKRKTNLLTDFEKEKTAVTNYSEEHRATPILKKITVVVPCHNARDTIVETLESVYSQVMPTGFELELIISDDGSTDGSCELVASMYPSAVILRHGDKTGPAAARNRGLRQAHGEYICFLDADDCYNPGFFVMAVEAFTREPRFGAIITGMELINSHREVHPAQLERMIWSHPSNMMIRRSIVDMMEGFPEDDAFKGQGASEDITFKQVLGFNFNIGFNEQKYLRYRVRRGGHFDLFLDLSRIEDGKVKFITPEGEDIDGLIPAGQRYGNAVVARITSVHLAESGPMTKVDLMQRLARLTRALAAAYSATSGLPVDHLYAENFDTIAEAGGIMDGITRLERSIQ